MAWIAGRSSAVAGRTCTRSPRIRALLAIQAGLERGEMRANVLRSVIAQKLVSVLDEFRPNGAKLAAHHARQHLQPARALEVVEQVESFGNRRADHDHAVVGEEHDALGA